MGALKIVVVVLLISIMLKIGLQVNRARLVAILKDYPLLSRALLANFVLVPIFGVVVTRLLHLQDEIAVGVLLMAIAPGLPLLPRKGGSKVGGSLDFAVALAFLLPALSIITIPLTARLVLPAGFAAHLPIGQFMTTLVLFELVPLVAGAVIAETSPRVAKVLDTPLSVVFALCTLLFIVGAAPALYKAVTSVYGSFGMLAAVVMVLLSFGTGLLLGGAEVEYRNTLAMGTALRNIGVAALVATESFPGTLVSAMVIGYFIIQLVVASLLGMYLTRTTRAPKAPPVATG